MNAKILLAPFTPIYSAIIGARFVLYRKGIFQSHDLGVPVVSVGNLTVGGTGKTPLVAWIARELAEKGHRVCVLTRGYKRSNPNERVLVSDGDEILADAKQSGDEAFELAQKLKGFAAVIADKNRVEAGNWARKELGITAFVLDDAFQHFKLKRDLDIVTVDATNPFGNGKPLPAGTLRESPKSLRRADAVVITRSDLASDIANLKSDIAKFNSNCPVLISNTKTTELKPLTEFGEFRRSIAQSSDKAQSTKHKAQIFAFCALGNPKGFFEHLKRDGFEIKGAKAFPDHHKYTQTDISEIERAARRSGADILLTTAKDAVKLKDLNLELSCFVVEIEIEFEDAAPLKKMLATMKKR